MTKTRKNAEGLIDLSGQVFGRLTVIEEDIEKRTYKENGSIQHRRWVCKCKYGVGVLRIKDRYFRAQWQDAQNKSKFKLFKIEEYGEELAHLLACEFRQHQLDLINLVS